MADAPTEHTDPARHDEGKPDRIVVLRDFCLRVHGGACDRCARACPHGAVSFGDDGKPAVDAASCTRCGICLGICDAFSSTRVTMADLHARIRRIALRGEGVVLTCEENIFPGFEPAANVVALPCLAALAPEFWTALLAEDIPLQVAADPAYCTDCNRAGTVGEMLYTHAIETAERWTARAVGLTDEIPEKDNLVRGLASSKDVDRRSALSGLATEMGDIASGRRRLRNSEVLREFYERRERSRAITRMKLGNGIEFNDFAPAGRTRKTLHPKRRLLLEAIDRDPSAAARIPLALPRIDPARCANALDCAAACPTGARFPHPENGAPSLDARYCIGCGLCVDACPEGAVELEERTAEALR